MTAHAVRPSHATKRGASSIERNIRELEGALIRVTAFASARTGRSRPLKPASPIYGRVGFVVGVVVATPRSRAAAPSSISRSIHLPMNSRFVLRNDGFDQQHRGDDSNPGGAMPKHIGALGALPLAPSRA